MQNKTPAEIIALYRERRPGMEITEGMARDTAGLDEAQPTPTELLEAINAYNETLSKEQEIEEESDNKITYDECLTYEEAQAKIKTKPVKQEENKVLTTQTTSEVINQKTAEIVRLSDSQTSKIIEDPFGRGILSPEAKRLERYLWTCSEVEYSQFLSNIKKRLIPNSPEEQMLYNQVTKHNINSKQEFEQLYEIFNRPDMTEPLNILQSQNHTISPKTTTVKSDIKDPLAAQKELLHDLRDWAAEQQGETADLLDGIYVTPELKNFIIDIKDLDRKIYVIQGLSGSGKSTTQTIIADDLREKGKTVVMWKLHQGLSLATVLESVIDILPEQTVEKLIIKLVSYVKKDNRTREYRGADSLRYYLSLVKPFQVMQALGSEIDVWSLIALKVDFLLIDFPDYNKDTQSQMNKDLDEVYNLWEKFNRLSSDGFSLNIVLFLQQEMCEANNHFFIKKATVPFTLRPLTPGELITFYTEHFDSNYPFTKEALNLIASQCGGTWRRYKKIIEQCLNNYNRKGDLKAQVTAENVTQWVDPELFAADRELEFEYVFPKSKQLQRKAAQTVSYLEQHNGEAFQIEITKLYFGFDKTAEKESSRFFKILESNDIVTSEFLDRRKFIKLKTSIP